MTSEETGKSILLVEDEALLATTLRRQIERLFGTACVHTAETCAQAESAWTCLNPDVVLMDYRLPDGVGTDVVAAMRKRGYREPVICMTAESEQISGPLRTTLAIDLVLTKPVTAAALQAALASVRQTVTPSTRTDHRIGRFRRIKLSKSLTAMRITRLLRAAQSERWIALDIGTLAHADDAALRGLCAWAGWLSSRGGRLCLLAQSPSVMQYFQTRIGTFVDVLNSPDRLLAQEHRLTGAAERRQLLKVLRPDDGKEVIL